MNTYGQIRSVSHTIPASAMHNAYWWRTEYSLNEAYEIVCHQLRFQFQSNFTSIWISDIFFSSFPDVVAFELNVFRKKKNAERLASNFNHNMQSNYASRHTSRNVHFCNSWNYSVHHMILLQLVNMSNNAHTYTSILSHVHPSFHCGYLMRTSNCANAQIHTITKNPVRHWCTRLCRIFHVQMYCWN